MMNAHYQTYSNLSSPHSPSPDETGSYTTLSSHTAGNSNGPNINSNNGIGGIGGGIGNGGGGGSGGNNSLSSSGNSVPGSINNSNNNNNNSSNNGCNIGIVNSNGNNTGTTNNHMNGHGNNNNNNNIGIGNCNGNNMVHHQNGSHNQQQQHMQMDNGDQPDFHHLNNNNNHNSSPIKTCAGCGGKILERYLLHALDRYWHNSCLKCYCCGALLADIGSSCYTKAGMILCKADYTRMFATAPCSSCGQIIAANEFVMRTTIPTSNNQNQNLLNQQQQQLQQQQQHHQSNQQIPILPENQKPYLGQMEHHVFHLKCFTCSKCSTQLRPGDRYYMLAGSLVCEPDWHKLLKNSTQNPPVRKGKVGRPRRTRD